MKPAAKSTRISAGSLLALLVWGCLSWRGIDPAQAADAPLPTELRIGTESGYPPFEFRDSTGALNGFDVEIGNALCAELHVKCTWVSQDFDGLVPALNAGKIDIIISSMTITPDRAKAIDFSQPYYRSLSQFIALKGAGITGDAASLRGKTIGVQSGTIHQVYAEQKLPDVSEKVYDTIQDAALDLESGRIDAVLGDKLVMYDWLIKEGAVKGFDFAGGPIVDPLLTADVGVGLPKGKPALKTAIDAAIDRILINGVYDHISMRYFPFSIRPE